MIQLIYKTILHIRQLSFPSEFRIQSDTIQLWAEVMGNALSQSSHQTGQLAEKLEHTEFEKSKLLEEINQLLKKIDEAGTENSKETMSSNFVISLCNDYFSLRQNSIQLENSGTNSRELRSMVRAIENIEDSFEENNIQCLDLSGQSYDVGRNDFIPIGDPEKKPGLNEEMISSCIRPAIRVNEKLIQKAQGIVAKPG